MSERTAECICFSALSLCYFVDCLDGLFFYCCPILNTCSTGPLMKIQGAFDLVKEDLIIWDCDVKASSKIRPMRQLMTMTKPNRNQ